jgi:hypothetical protein
MACATARQLGDIRCNAPRRLAVTFVYSHGNAACRANHASAAATEPFLWSVAAKEPHHASEHEKQKRETKDQRHNQERF